MVKTSSESVGTMRATSTMSEGAQTMIEHNSTMLESDLGTMVINSEDEEEEDGTMKRNATSPQVQRPSFMDYFDKQDFKNKSHENCNQNRHEPFPMSKNVFPDNWKVPQDGDFDFIRQPAAVEGDKVETVVEHRAHANAGSSASPLQSPQQRQPCRKPGVKELLVLFSLQLCALRKPLQLSEVFKHIVID
ncbi:hypothetical protein CB1_001652003 [Camelus ferus]|nr:hypothetical protein CB1_001652003 [Camelus ferus]